jgi:hypothetical protein
MVNNSFEPIRCEAMTKTGRQCRKVFVPKQRSAKYCAVHRPRRSILQLRRYNKIKKSNFERVMDGARIASGTAAAIKIIHEVVRFLIAHWSEINQFFHGLDTNSHLQYWQSYRNDCRKALDLKFSDAEARDLVVEFQRWFPTLPPGIQRMVITEVGGSRIKGIYREAEKS